MAVSLSAVVLLAIVVFLLLRSGSLRVLPGLAAITFGFFLAFTGVGEPIHAALGGVTHLLAQINF